MLLRLLAPLIMFVVLAVPVAAKSGHIKRPGPIDFDPGKEIGEISFICRIEPKKVCTLSEFMKSVRVCALVVLKDGKLSLMRFAKGLCDSRPGKNSEEKHYGIASVAKSITSTLLGAGLAARYGAMTRADFEAAVAKTVDEVIPDLGPGKSKGGYAGVAIERVLNMRSGVKWDEREDSRDSKAFEKEVKEDLEKTIIAFAQGYKTTGETDYAELFNYSALDALVNGAMAETLLGKLLTDYLTDPIWAELGMEANARWRVDKAQMAIGACCFYLTARDLARFGQFVLARGKTPDGRQLMPSAWFELATGHGPDGADQVPPDDKESYMKGCPLDYRYQWWLRPAPAKDFTAIGRAGQFVHIYPEEHAVVVQIADWGIWENGFARTCMSLLAHDALIKAAGP